MPKWQENQLKHFLKENGIDLEGNKEFGLIADVRMLQTYFKIVLIEKQQDWEIIIRALKKITK